MSTDTTILPQRAGDIAPDALLHDLVARLDGLTGARCARATSSTGTPIRRWCSPSWRSRREIGERMRQRLPCTMREALWAEATVAEVGTDPAEVAAALAG